MVRSSWCKVLVATSAAAYFSFGHARDAAATLGGDVASIATDEQQLAATRQLRKLASGERHDLTLPSGVLVHEYVSPGGRVYAVTWRGPRVPDLRGLLGPYFAQLDSRCGSAGGHHRMALTGPDLRVQASGHGRWFAGRAWVPSLVPAGVQVDASLE